MELKLLHGEREQPCRRKEVRCKREGGGGRMVMATGKGGVRWMMGGGRGAERARGMGGTRRRVSTPLFLNTHTHHSHSIPPSLQELLSVSQPPSLAVTPLISRANACVHVVGGLLVPCLVLTEGKQKPHACFPAGDSSSAHHFLFPPPGRK